MKRTEAIECLKEIKSRVGKILFDDKDEENAIIDLLADHWTSHEILIMGVSIVHDELKRLVKYNISGRTSLGPDELKHLEQQLIIVISMLKNLDTENTSKKDLFQKLCDKLSINKDLVMGW